MKPLQIDLTDWKKADEWALAACQDHHLGNASDWFGCFRGGYYGMKHRVYGLTRHYDWLHQWSDMTGFDNHEFNFVSFMFNADSAVECMIFALNGLGCAFAAVDFVDISSNAGLSRIGPANVFGSKREPARAGYGKYFPVFTALVQKHATTIQVVMENHDVSKHRRLSFGGGKSQLNPPPGFAASRGLAEGDPRVGLFAPMEYVDVLDHPKTPSTAQQIKLEPVAEDLCDFLSASGSAVLADASTCLQARRVTL